MTLRAATSPLIVVASTRRALTCWSVRLPLMVPTIRLPSAMSAPVMVTSPEIVLAVEMRPASVSSILPLVTELRLSGSGYVVRVGTGPDCAELPVSRPAVSQHLRVLKEAGLVTERRNGTRRIYRLDPDGLGELRDYFDDFWSEALAAFKARAEDERRNG